MRALLDALSPRVILLVVFFPRLQLFALSELPVNALGCESTTAMLLVELRPLGEGFHALLLLRCHSIAPCFG